MMGDFFRKGERERGLLSMEAVTLVYMLLTTVMAALCWGNIDTPQSMLFLRMGVLAGMGLLLCVYRLWPCRFTILLRMVFCMVMLIAWYPETYEFCKQFDYHDHWFARADWLLFGCQPSLEFSQWLDGRGWAETFCLGYYSYYYIMVATVLFYLFARYRQMQWATFVYMASFFLFYLFYELFPVAGPQYYFHYIGVEQAAQGIYPPPLHHFAHSTEALSIEPRGLWSQLVVGAQEVGERPTAAFPSSHVGMTVVTLMLAWRTHNRWLFWATLAFGLPLFCGTVYIKAHYLVDSLAGVAFGLGFFYLTDWLFPYARRRLALKP